MATTTATRPLWRRPLPWIVLTLVAAVVVAGLAVAAVLEDAAPAVHVQSLPASEVAAAAARTTEVGRELDLWWRDQADRLGAEPFPMVGERLTDGDDGLRCGRAEVVLDDDLLLNAWAALCPEGPTVAYDPALFTSEASLLITMAHEWGHIAQGADPVFGDVDGPSIEVELQADCYAGAWSVDGLDPEDLDDAIADVRSSGDPFGTSKHALDAHGTADQREAAFRRGRRGGIAACLPGPGG